MRPIIPILLVVVGACSLASLGVVDQIDPMLDDQSQVASVQAQIAVIKARHEAVEELLAGRLTFTDTAERFRQLAANDPCDCLRWLRIYCPDCSDDELYYQHVILYTKVRLRQLYRDLSFADELRNQLEEIRNRGIPHDCWNDEPSRNVR